MKSAVDTPAVCAHANRGKRRPVMTNPNATTRRKPGAGPALALGTMNFGKRTPEPESERIVRRALERGIQVYDTANAYNAGASERILGRALGRDRSRVVVSTKAGIGLAPARPEGLSPDAMKRALEGSLARLGTDVVDIYYLHVPDRATPVERTVEAMGELIASGQVRTWGVSNYASWEILEMCHLADHAGMARPTVAQVLYNALHRQLDIEYFAFARRYGVYTVTYNALAGGLLTGRHNFGERPEKGTRFDANPMYERRYWTRSMFERVEQLMSIARDEGCSLVELAYAWVAAQADVDSVLLGPATVEQLDQALDAVGRELSPTTRKRVDDAYRDFCGTDTNYVR